MLDSDDDGADFQGQPQNLRDEAEQADLAELAWLDEDSVVTVDEKLAADLL